MENEILKQNFPLQALDQSKQQVSILNDDDRMFESRAIAALRIVEKEFMLRRKFAQERDDQVHFERSNKKLLELRVAISLLEYGLDEGDYRVNATTPNKITVA